jgi:hypothetical protein
LGYYRRLAFATVRHQRTAIDGLLMGIQGTIKLGFDRHIVDVEPTIWQSGALVSTLSCFQIFLSLLTCIKATWIIEFFIVYSTTFTKLSVLLFHRRLVSGTVSKKFKLAIYLAMAFVIASVIIFTVLLILTCNPVDYYWYQYSTKPHNGHCKGYGSQVAGGILQGTFSVISDFYSVVLPATLLLRIRISRRQRFGLMFIFGLGFMLAFLLISIVLTCANSHSQGCYCWMLPNLLPWQG